MYLAAEMNAYMWRRMCLNTERGTRLCMETNTFGERNTVMYGD